MPISRVLLFVLVGLIGLAGGQEHKPEEVVSGAIELGYDGIIGVYQGFTDGIKAVRAGSEDPAPNTSPRNVPSRCCKSPVFPASTCGCQVLLWDISQVILEIQAGLVELRCLSVLSADKKPNVDGVWGARTKAGFDRFTKRFLGDRAAAEAKLGPVGTPEFYDKLLQQIEDAKETGQYCTETTKEKNGKPNQISPPRNVPSLCCESPVFPPSMCGCQVLLWNINQVIFEIQAGLVELGCLSAITPDKKPNIDGRWGPLTNTGYDKFARNFLGDRAAAEAKLGPAGTPEFYDKLLQQIEDAKKTNRRCMETNKAETNRITGPASSVEGRIAKIKTIYDNDITINSFKIIVDGRLARSLIGCWNGGRVKIDISSIEIISFKEDNGICFSSNLSSSNCSFRGFETSIRFRNGTREKVVLRKEDSGPSILGNSQFGQWYADVSNIKQIKFINH